MSKWSYISRTIPDISNHLRRLEDTIRSDFIPSITGRPPPNDSVRNLLALPARLGGLGILDPSLRSDDEFNASTKVTAPLTHLMKQKDGEFTHQVSADQITAKSDIQRERRKRMTQAASTLREEVPPALSKAMDLASQPGASSWLTSLPIKEHGFCLHKGAFVDAMALRYGWTPTNTPTHCACGASFAVDHILSCPRGGFPSIRHNEIRDLTARLLTEVCNDVQIEPELQEITTETMSGRSANTTNGARLDIAASGLWGGRRERTLVDVRVFNPFAPSNCNTTLDRCYTKHEREKVRAYGQRIREIEHATFVPLVMSATGGLAKQAINFYKRLASLLADKWEQPYRYHFVLAAMFLILQPAPFRHPMHTWCTIFKGPCCETFTSRPGDRRGQPTAELTDVFCDFPFTPLLYITTFHFFIDRHHIFSLKKKEKKKRMEHELYRIAGYFRGWKFS